jgi:hypothetical protein
VRVEATSDDLLQYAKYLRPSIYVETSTSNFIGRTFVATKRGWVYKIQAPVDEGINVNRALG